MSRRALVIVNPIAGRGAGQHALEEVERGLRRRGLSTEVAVTSRAGDARQAAARAEGHDVVVAVGGDGTLNEVINGLEADRPVALFPLGTGNVLAKELGLPRRVESFCEMVRAGGERALDLGSAEGRRFVSFAGIGFDAEVSALLHERRRGAIHIVHYAAPIVRCLATYDFPALEVSVDGREPERSAGFVLVSNVRSYGGPLVVTPDAVPDDGLFDVCTLPRGSRARYLGALLGFLLRCPRRCGGARYFRGRSVRVTGERPVRYQVDGDAAGFVPALFEMLDRKLRIVVPQA